MLFCLGSIEFGRLVWTREALHATAIAGARCMGIHQNACASGGAYNAANSQSYITAVANGMGLSLPVADMTLNAAATCAGVTGFSQVSISYSFQTVIPGVVTSWRNGVPLTVSACFPNQS